MLNKQQFITDILKSDESLQNFIIFWRRQYKYAFINAIYQAHIRLGASSGNILETAMCVASFFVCHMKMSYATPFFDF